MIDTPALATRIIRDADAHAYALPAPANRTAALKPLDALPVRFELPIGFGMRIGIAGHRRPSLRALMMPILIG